MPEGLYVGLSLALNFVILVVSILTTDLTLILDAVGGTSANCLIFIIPALCWLQSIKKLGEGSDQKHLSNKRIAYLFIGIGFVLFGCQIAVTLPKMFKNTKK